jgi:uncharacterized protein YcbX
MLGPHLTELWIYLLKGARGVSIRHWTIDPIGLHLDRRWMLVDATGSAIYQRTNSRMALVDVALDDESLRLQAPGMPEMAIPLSEASSPESAVVDVMGSRVAASVVPGDASRWFQDFLGVPCTLVHMPDDAERRVDPHFAANQRTSFTNGYPVHLVTQESLDALNDRLEVPVIM